jgi:hypothetical protein
MTSMSDEHVRRRGDEPAQGHHRHRGFCRVIPIQAGPRERLRTGSPFHRLWQAGRHDYGLQGFRGCDNSSLAVGGSQRVRHDWLDHGAPIASPRMTCGRPRVQRFVRQASSVTHEQLFRLAAVDALQHLRALVAHRLAHGEKRDAGSPRGRVNDRRDPPRSDPHAGARSRTRLTQRREARPGMAAAPFSR